MTTLQLADILRTVDLLAAAFQHRDLQAALACFTPDHDISYIGSEPTEAASGRAAVTLLLAELFTRPEAYSWAIHSATVVARDGIAYLSCEALGHLRTDTGHEESFPYRLSGLLEHTESGWLWRACHGCEPTGTCQTR
jgi:hypothetical protein